MAICYINEDGSHVRGCDEHRGQHPYQWCETARKQRAARMEVLRQELETLTREAMTDTIGTWEPDPHEERRHVATTARVTGSSSGTS